MSDDKNSSQTYNPILTTFVMVIALSMTMAPTLSNYSFLTPFQPIIDLSYAQSGGDNSTDSISATDEVDDSQEPQQPPLQQDDSQEPQQPPLQQDDSQEPQQPPLQQDDSQEPQQPPLQQDDNPQPLTQTSPTENETSPVDSPINDNFTNTPLEGPDGDCLFNPELPKCAAVDGECPDGFNQNEDEQCVPESGCPDGYHTVDDDESGRCIPNSDGCPSGMIFRPDGKTCGYKDQLCHDDPQLEGCIETPQECNNNIDDDGDGLIDSADPDCKQQPKCDPSYPDRCIPSPPPDLDCEDIVYRNFQVNSSDPHGFDKDEDGIGCETKSDSEPDDNDDGDQDSTTTTSNTLTIPQDTCSDATGIVKIGPGRIDSHAVRIVAFFDECELASASLLSNYIPNENLKLVVATFDQRVSDAVEVIQTPIQYPNQEQIFYTVTITSNQQGYDLESGELKTISGVNGIVLWNDGNEPIVFDEDDTIEVTLDFFN